jgi:ketosteroid isomerase-like protein
MLRTALLMLASSAFLAGCAAERDDVLPEDLSVVRPQLDSLWARLEQAMLAADTATLRMIYTDSATFAETGWPTARGREAIVSGASGVFACCRYIESRFQPEVTEVSGNRATQFGTYRDVIEPTGQPRLAMFGRVSATLERDTTGAWRVSRLVVIRDSSVTLKATSARRPPNGP